LTEATEVKQFVQIATVKHESQFQLKTQSEMTQSRREKTQYFFSDLSFKEKQEQGVDGTLHVVVVEGNSCTI